MSHKDNLLPVLLKRKRILEDTIKRTAAVLKQGIEGHLEVNYNRKHYRYYFNISKKDKQSGNANSKRSYIKDIGFAKKLAERDYSKVVMNKGLCELKHIDALIKIYQESTVDEVYRDLHPGRKLIVDPILPDDDLFADMWLVEASKEALRYKNAYPIQLPLQTDNHEIVRSKSEKIIADKLRAEGVPYVYEKPIRLGGVVKYPDFTVLNKRNRHEMYWEHMGLMDQVDYFKSATDKIDFYSRNNIWVGENLIITYETSDHPIDIDMIDRIIHKYLL